MLLLLLFTFPAQTQYGHSIRDCGKFSSFLLNDLDNFCFFMIRGRKIACKESLFVKHILKHVYFDKIRHFEKPINFTPQKSQKTRYKMSHFFVIKNPQSFYFLLFTYCIQQSYKRPQR